MTVKPLRIWAYQWEWGRYWNAEIPVPDPYQLRRLRRQARKQARRARRKAARL